LVENQRFSTNVKFAISFKIMESIARFARCFFFTGQPEMLEIGPVTSLGISPAAASSASFGKIQCASRSGLLIAGYFFD
jgi:hypothetical protein